MRILIADDHAVVRQGLKHILAEAFKRAFFGESANAQQTLERVWKEPWDIVILDLTMPRMDGMETFRELRRIRENARVILSSGYNETEVVDRFAGRGLAGFIQKPYVSATLTAKIREAISK